jgi:predicted GH43/DUF377 family glycosyl hydrolase
LSSLTASPAAAFEAMRLGVIMRPDAHDPDEAWGVMNPGGVRSPDGAMHLFPRLIAEGNYSRIGHACVRYDGQTPAGVERHGLALAPLESYEVGPGGGGVEDPRVVYVAAIERYVMTYTAFIPYAPRIAIAVSDDLWSWRRIGLVRYEVISGAPDLNLCGNKDAALLPEPVSDPDGVLSLAILHRPTTRVKVHHEGADVSKPPSGEETRESIWISYVALEAVLADVASLTSVSRHERVMAPEQPWEKLKIGTGAPPVRLPYGWVLPYHAVSSVNGHRTYSMGAAILDPQRPSRVLYRTPAPILTPDAEYERNGLVANVVFPSGSDLRPDGSLDVYYGAADRVVAVARISLPTSVPNAQ